MATATLSPTKERQQQRMKPQERIRLSADVLLADQGADAESRTFWGTATTFGSLNSYWYAIAPGALADSYENFLKRGYIGGLNHNDDDPIGAPIEVRNDGLSLYLKAELAPGIPEADRVLALMSAQVGRDKRPVVQMLSIGARAKSYMTLDSKEALEEWWGEIGYPPTQLDHERADLALRYDGYVAILTKGELREVSPVLYGASPGSYIAGVRQSEGDEDSGDEPVCENSPQAKDSSKDEVQLAQPGVSQEGIDLIRRRLVLVAQSRGVCFPNRKGDC